MSHRHLSDHLSEIVENTINDLEQSKVFFFLYNIALSSFFLGCLSREEVSALISHGKVSGSYLGRNVPSVEMGSGFFMR